MKTDRKALLVRIVSAVLLLFACFFMYDFYKCLSGFIANGFREPQVMLPMILAFFLPVFCFLLFFYDCYIRAIKPVTKTVCSLLVAVSAAADLVMIFLQIGLYASNNALGVYDALPSIIFHFPYDMIAVLLVLLAWQIFRLVAPTHAALDGLKQRGTVSVGTGEYFALSLPAVFAFVFAGSALTATFTAFSNAFYDWRYIFLLLWVGVVPLGNLLLLALRPDKMALSGRTKLTLLGTGIGVNLLFGLLFLVLELTYPDFIVHVGKPLFLIAFSVSLPIEPLLILAIMALGTVLFVLRFVRVLKQKEGEL